MTGFLEGEAEISSINYTRVSRGGGVSILFKKSVMSLKEYRFNHHGHELVAASGKIPGNNRPILVVGIYIKPSITAEKKSSLIDSVNSLLSKFKTENANPFICLGGDFNRYPAARISLEHSEVKLLDSPQPELTPAWMSPSQTSK